MTSTQIETTQKPPTIQQFVSSDKIIASAEKTLGSRGQQFLTSILTMANSTPAIASCEPRSLYNACLTAATLDLPINQNLGFAYIVPYKNNKTRTTEAQFQMGWKGFVQLAIRSGKFSRIGVNPVHDGQLISYDDFSGEPVFDFNAEHTDKIIGYMAYFELTNGFRKIDYMNMEQIEAHAKKYSQSYKDGFGVWKDNFDAMAKKTVIKLLLQRWAPLSTEMAQAIEDDQKVTDEYSDNKISFDVDNMTIDGEFVEQDYLDEPVDETEQAFDVALAKDEPFVGRLTGAQLKKLMVETGKLSDELKETEKEARQLLYRGRSRSTFTKDEASKHIEYVISLQNGETK